MVVEALSATRLYDGLSNRAPLDEVLDRGNNMCHYQLFIAVCLNIHLKRPRHVND